MEILSTVDESIKFVGTKHDEYIRFSSGNWLVREYAGGWQLCWGTYEDELEEAYQKFIEG